jgi:hypothetical protein
MQALSGNKSSIGKVSSRLSELGHVRLVCGVCSLPIGAPVIVDTIFEIHV